MKNTPLICLAFLLGFSLSASGQMAPEDGKVLFIDGEVSILSPGDTAPTVAVPGQPVPSGSKVFTAEGAKCMIGLTRGASTLVEESSELEVQSIQAEHKGQRTSRRDIDLEVKKGSAISFLETLGSETDYSVRSPVGVVAARGTIWRTGTDIVQVMDGVVSIELPDGSTVAVPAGKQMTANGEVDVIDDETIQQLLSLIRSTTKLDAKLLYLEDGTARIVIENAETSIRSEIFLNPVTSSDSETNNGNPEEEPDPEPVMVVPPPTPSFYP